MLSALVGAAGVLLVVIIGLDVVGTLVITEGFSRLWRPSRHLYRWSWLAWRFVGGRVKSEQGRERWLAIYGPLSLLTLLLFWMVMMAISWALIYRGVLGELHGTSDFPGLFYYAGAGLFAPGYGDLANGDAPIGLLTLLNTAMGFGTIALVIAYLPVLYGSYNRREARLLTLDDPSGDRITPGAIILIHAPEGDLDPLYRFFADWELWTADVLESHVSYPMLAYFRSQHVGQSWITALGVVLDAAALACAFVPGADEREAYFMYRRGRRALTQISRRLEIQRGGPDPITRDLFELVYERLRAGKVPLYDFETGLERIQSLRSLYAADLQGLIDYVLAPPGFWGHSAELD